MKSIFFTPIDGGLRSTANRFTPNNMMLGRQVNTLAQVMSAMIPETFMASLVDIIKQTHDLARAKLRMTTQWMKRSYYLGDGDATQKARLDVTS